LNWTLSSFPPALACFIMLIALALAASSSIS
jgi:hypothetical protein